MVLVMVKPFCNNRKSPLYKDRRLPEIQVDTRRYILIDTFSVIAAKRGRYSNQEHEDSVERIAVFLRKTLATWDIYSIPR
jgi:hypothetical protein